YLHPRSPVSPVPSAPGPARQPRALRLPGTPEYNSPNTASSHLQTRLQYAPAAIDPPLVIDYIQLLRQPGRQPDHRIAFERAQRQQRAGEIAGDMSQRGFWRADSVTHHAPVVGVPFDDCE